MGTLRPSNPSVSAATVSSVQHFNSSITENRTEFEMELPEDMRYSTGHTVSIVSYSILMVVSAVGNISVLCTLLRRRRGARSRINTMLLHLAIADLLVTFLLMPLEIAWASTVSWEAGDAACRIMAFFRIFGLFLSGFVLACISIDRYFAVLKPLKLSTVDQRGKVMLSVAWMASVICSLPQVVVFHVERHPNITWFEQCVTYNSFPSNEYELTYSLFGMVMMYALPLAIITFSYISILAEIFRRSRDSESDSEVEKIRRSSLGYLGKAKVRTLKMTVTIVLVFVVCWTPYYVMCLWYWVDRPSALLVDFRIQKALFIFACTNSCANPIVYGAFNAGRGRRRRRGRLRRNSSRSGAEMPHRFICARSSDDHEGMEAACLVSWRKRAPTTVALHPDQQHIQPGRQQSARRLTSASSFTCHADTERRKRTIGLVLRESLSVPGHI